MAPAFRVLGVIRGRSLRKSAADFCWGARGWKASPTKKTVSLCGGYFFVVILFRFLEKPILLHKTAAIRAPCGRHKMNHGMTNYALRGCDEAWDGMLVSFRNISKNNQ